MPVSRTETVRTDDWMLLLLALSLVGSALLGCTSPSRLAVDPSAGSLEADARSAQIPSSDSLFQSCWGVRLGKGVFEMQCRDHRRFYVARYDVSSSAEQCRTVIQRVYREASLHEGPRLGLPDSSHVYRLTGMAGAEVSGSAGTKGLAVCVPHRDRGLGLLLAQQGLVPDSTYAASALMTLAYNGVPGGRVLSDTSSEVPFLGRALPVHASCEFKDAQNLSCFPNGQMNWGTFSTVDRAQKAQSLQIQASRQSAESVLSDTTIACTFEGVKTQCRRIVYRAPVSKIATLGASNVLIAFYATARVRGRPARAVCSLYRDQARSNGLAPLCQETFEVPAADTLLSRTPK